MRITWDYVIHRYNYIRCNSHFLNTAVHSVGKAKLTESQLKGSVLTFYCCSVAKLCPALCNPVKCPMLGFPVLHYLLQFAQIHVHWVGDAIQLSHPLSILWFANGSRSDRIPAELFQILKDDTFKVLHSICQPNLENSAVATGLEKVSFHSKAKECSNYHTIALILHASKVMLKIL